MGKARQGVLETRRTSVLHYNGYIIYFPIFHSLPVFRYSPLSPTVPLQDRLKCG